MFPGGQLGGDEQIQRSLKSGTVHLGSIASSNMSIVSDAYSWGDLPYVFKSPESVQKVFNDPAISEGISTKMRADTGTVVLGHIEVGGFRILINTKRSLKSPADIDGIEVPQAGQPHRRGAALLVRGVSGRDAVERGLRVDRAGGRGRPAASAPGHRRIRLRQDDPLRHPPTPRP